MTIDNTNDRGKSGLDNRAEQLNPNNNKFWKSRQQESRSPDWKDQSRPDQRASSNRAKGKS